ncbi:preprotein translocase subunit SecG [Octadecabacter sp.]|nr:preprotein translocase subunit SecG [Octadecabacter sp.]MDC1500575.1 preprotein translocase subunit SecG [Octadecabacter sp.]
MENVVLVVHLLLALSLIGVVLLQRSEGGGLGMGGGGGGNGAMSGRAAATALGKITWLLAIAFIITSITLTILSARQASDASVVGGDALLPPTEQTGDAQSAGESLLPPSAPSDAPLIPNAD